MSTGTRSPRARAAETGTPTQVTGITVVCNLHKEAGKERVACSTPLALTWHQERHRLQLLKSCQTTEET